MVECQHWRRKEELQETEQVNSVWKRESKGTFGTSNLSASSCYTDLTGSQILKNDLRHEKPVSNHLRYDRVYDWIMNIICIVSKQNITHILIKSQYLLYTIQNEIE